MRRAVLGLFGTSIAAVVAGCAEPMQPPGPGSLDRIVSVAHPDDPRRLTSSPAAEGDVTHIGAPQPAEAELPEIDEPAAPSPHATFDGERTVSPPHGGERESPADRVMSLILEELDLRSQLQTESDPDVRATLEARKRAIAEERRAQYGPMYRTKEHNP